MKSIKDRLYIATFETDALSVAKEYGLGLEMNHTCISEALDKDCGRLISKMKEDAACSSAVPILHGPFTEIYPAAIDPLARELAFKRLEQAFEVCAALGINRMVVHTGWLPSIYFRDWQAEKSAVFWQRFMKDKPKDFSLFIENVLEDTPLMLADMMKLIPDRRVKLCLDVGHANVMTPDIFPVTRWISELAPRIGHFHLHNNYGDMDSHGDFSSGSMDMDEVLSTALKLCSSDTTFTIEADDCRSCAKWLAKHGYIDEQD